MSEAIPMLSEPPSPSAEQLADWQALAERIRQGDRSQLAAWDEEGVAVGSPATYQVFVTQRFHQRWGRAPPSVGRLGRWRRRRPSGGSDRGQHDLSPAPPW